jgi:hypothetical protein
MNFTPGPGARERRHENRRSIQGKARLKILQGPAAQATYEVLTRDMSLSGVSFVLRLPLDLGQICQIEMPFPGGRPQPCEVVRSRPLSNGRYEMAVQFSKKPGPG